jgi:hypothetical protein
MDETVVRDTNEHSTVAAVLAQCLRLERRAQAQNPPKDERASHSGLDPV